jgi:hypothetical protein
VTEAAAISDRLSAAIDDRSLLGGSLIADRV